MPLTPESLTVARDFFAGPIWGALRSEIEKLKPSTPNVQADALTTASMFRRREGWEAYSDALNAALGLNVTPVEVRRDGTNNEGVIDQHSDETPFIDTAKD
jgi:hypothetical protein